MVVRQYDMYSIEGDRDSLFSFMAHAMLVFPPVIIPALLFIG